MLVQQQQHQQQQRQHQQRQGRLTRPMSTGSAASKIAPAERLCATCHSRRVTTSTGHYCPARHRPEKPDRTPPTMVNTTRSSRRAAPVNSEIKPRKHTASHTLQHCYHCPAITYSRDTFLSDINDTKYNIIICLKVYVQS